MQLNTSIQSPVKTQFRIRLIGLIAMLTIPFPAFGLGPREPTAAEAYTKQQAAKPEISCLELLRQLEGSTGEVRKQLLTLRAATQVPLDEYINNYGNFCRIRDMADAAQEKGRGRKADYKCYRDMKNFISKSAVWLTASPISGGSAYLAKDQLLDNNLIDILPSHPEYGDDPSLAPLGAIIIYERNDKPCPIWMRKWMCSISSHGDIQIRTADGFYSGFYSPNSMLLQPAGPVMRVSAVMIKPLKATRFNKDKQCFETDVLD